MQKLNINNFFKKKQEVKKMARRFRVRRSRPFMKARSYGRRSSGGTGLMASVLGAMAYGAVREKASTALAPLTANIPLGNIADEVALGGIAVLLKRTLARKMPMITPVLNGAIAIESARIGEAIIKGQVGLGGVSQSSTNMLG